MFNQTPRNSAIPRSRKKSRNQAFLAEFGFSRGISYFCSEKSRNLTSRGIWTFLAEFPILPEEIAEYAFFSRNSVIFLNAITRNLEKLGILYFCWVKSQNLRVVSPNSTYLLNAKFVKQNSTFDSNQTSRNSAIFCPKIAEFREV